MTDWPALIEPVARLLLADRPCRRHGPDLRFGRRGSLRVTVAGPGAGTWRDHEADAKGGTLALVEHLTGRRGADARAWLADARLIEPDGAGSVPDGRSAHRPQENGAHSGPVSDPREPCRVSGPPESERPPRPPSPTAPIAAGILDGAVAADDSPARVYLARRWTWPPVGHGPDLPATVRWCHARDVPTDARLPSTAAGVIVWELIPGPDGAGAVRVEAVTAAGDLLPVRWRRSFGAWAPFMAVDRPGGSLLLTEGDASALAVALVTTAGTVRSVGGSANYRAEAAGDAAARPVVLVPDGDHAGAAAVVRLLADPLDGRTVTVEPWPRAADGDPADWLRDHLTERAGLAEYRGADLGEATAAAWRSLLADVVHGKRILPIEVGAEAVSAAPAP